ncbi:MAG: type II toxin-antitoxin system PemK/MazF family toxin [Vulcanimicrobiota bacterium]
MIKRGDIYFVNLNPTKGREQKGRRPVLVVSSNAINSQPLVIITVVGTEGVNVPKDYPVNVRLSQAETGLPVETVFLCFQVWSLDPSRFKDAVTGEAKPAGIVPPQRMKDVDEALRLSLSL